MSNAKLRRYAFASFLLGNIAMPRAGNQLTENLSKLTGEAAKRYVAPVVSGFGANMNAGWQADSLVQFIERDPRFAVMLPQDRKTMED